MSELITLLGDITYDIATLGSLASPIKLKEDVGRPDDLADYYKFSVSQRNGIFFHVSTSDSITVKVIAADGTQKAKIAIGHIVEGYYFFNVDPGTYQLEFESANGANTTYDVDVYVGTPDTQIASFQKAGWWYDASTAISLGTLSNAQTSQVNGYVLWQRGYNQLYQWFGDIYTFTLAEDSTVTFDIDLLKNPGWVDFQVDSPVNSSGNPLLETSNIDGPISVNLLKGSYTFSIAGDGASGAPTQYNISFAAKTPAYVDSGSTPDHAKPLGDITYDVATLGRLTSPIKLKEDVGRPDDLADYYQFSVSQRNGIFFHVSTSDSITVKVIEADGTQKANIAIGHIVDGYYFFNVDPGTYQLEFESANGANTTYDVDVYVGTPDTQIASFQRARWSDASTAISLGTFSNAQTSQVDGYLLLQGGYSQLYQWFGDIYTFSLAEDSTVTFDIDLLKNSGWVDFQINGGQVLDTTRIDGPISVNLVKGSYTFSIAGFGASGAPTQYNIFFAVKTLSYVDSGSTPDQAKPLGDITYDVATLGRLTSPIKLKEDVGRPDDLADYYQFSVSQRNGIFFHVSTSDSIAVKVIAADGTQKANIAIGHIVDGYYFFNVDPGTYQLEFESANGANTSYDLDVYVGTPDTQIASFQRAGSWYDASTEISLGTLSNAQTTQVDGYLLLKDGYSQLDQWNADSYAFSLAEDSTVTFDVNLLKNPAFVDFQVDSPVNYSGNPLLETSNIDGPITVNLLKGSYTFSILGFGASGAPTQYEITTSLVAQIFNHAVQGSVTITGTPTQGQTLTVANTLSDLDGIPASGVTGALAYQWSAAGTAITGATGSTFVLTQAEVGKTITVTASYTDLQGTSESASSTATSAVLGYQVGTAGDDVLTGTAFADTLITDTGADLVNAGAGNDTLTLSADGTWASGFACANQGMAGVGGTGQQVLLYGKVRFADVLHGGDDADTLQLTSGSDAFFLHDAYSLFNVSAALTQDAAGKLSTARASGIEIIQGGAGDDIIDLTSLDYTIGAVSVFADIGNDIVWGNAGNDTLQGGDGADTLFGGAGSNTLNGGAGADIFQYAKSGTAQDTVQDFQMGIDTIVLYGAASTTEVSATAKADRVTLNWGTQTIDLMGITSTTGWETWLQLA